MPTVEVVKRERPLRYEVLINGKTFKTYKDIGMARRMAVALKWEAKKAAKV